MRSMDVRISWLIEEACGMDRGRMKIPLPGDPYALERLVKEADVLPVLQSKDRMSDACMPLGPRVGS
jgi:hypothetical protein